MREGNGASGIKIEGELMIAEMSCRPKLFQSPTGSSVQAVGFEPAFHPDVAAFGFPDFGEFEGAATARALKRVIAKASLNPLTPSEVLEGGGEGFQVEERGLEAKSFEGRASDPSDRGRSGGSGRDRWDGRGDATRVGLRRMKPDSGWVSRAVSFGCAKSILHYNTSLCD
jgi:hypothetical protein